MFVCVCVYVHAPVLASHSNSSLTYGTCMYDVCMHVVCAFVYAPVHARLHGGCTKASWSHIQ